MLIISFAQTHFYPCKTFLFFPATFPLPWACAHHRPVNVSLHCSALKHAAYLQFILFQEGFRIPDFWGFRIRIGCEPGRGRFSSHSWCDG